MTCPHKYLVKRCCGGKWWYACQACDEPVTQFDSYDPELVELRKMLRTTTESEPRKES